MTIELVIDDQGSSLSDFLERASAAMAPEVLLSAEHIDGSFHVAISELPSFDYYVDPLIERSAGELDRDLTTDTIRFWLRSGDRWQLSMNDAWTLPAWDAWLDHTDDRPIMLLHADDHDDLMAPRLHIRRGAWSNALTGEHVTFGNGSLAAAVRSSAIGMGSFLTVMVHHPRVTELRHLRGRPHRYDDLGWLRRASQPDPLWPARNRLAVEPTSTRSDIRFRRVEHVEHWIHGIDDECVALVHVDLDYLSNRYDCDSDWRERTDLFDPPPNEVRGRLRAALDAIDSIADQVAGVAFAISPGFFPAEHWVDAVADIEAWAEARRATAERSSGSVHKRVSDDRVRLVRGRGSPGRGAGGNYWQVLLGDKRAGHVFINAVDDEQLGPHMSIQIHLNEKSRGRGVGSVAYRRACEESGCDIVYAHMRKSNTASKLAARNAGFREVDGDFRQLVMRWSRSAGS